jgi:hypothetical protein
MYAHNIADKNINENLKSNISFCFNDAKTIDKKYWSELNRRSLDNPTRN